MSCPHYLGEVVIYAGLALVACAGLRATAWLMLLWVVSGWRLPGGSMRGARLLHPGGSEGREQRLLATHKYASRRRWPAAGDKPVAGSGHDAPMVPRALQDLPAPPPCLVSLRVLNLLGNAELLSALFWVHG